MTHVELEQALASSSMSQAGAALTALQAGWTFEVSMFNAPYSVLANTYAIRSEHLNTMRSPHALQLAASAREFADNLAQSGLASGTLITISGPAEHEFEVWATPAGQVIGCLRTIGRNAVSEERWNELWS